MITNPHPRYRLTHPEGGAPKTNHFLHSLPLSTSTVVIKFQHEFWRGHLSHGTRRWAVFGVCNAKEPQNQDLMTTSTSWQSLHAGHYSRITGIQQFPQWTPLWKNDPLCLTSVPLVPSGRAGWEDDGIMVRIGMRMNTCLPQTTSACVLSQQQVVTIWCAVSRCTGPEKGSAKTAAFSLAKGLAFPPEDLICSAHFRKQRDGPADTTEKIK